MHNNAFGNLFGALKGLHPVTYAVNYFSKLIFKSMFSKKLLMRNENLIFTLSDFRTTQSRIESEPSAQLSDNSQLSANSFEGNLILRPCKNKLST